MVPLKNNRYLVKNFFIILLIKVSNPQENSHNQVIGRCTSNIYQVPYNALWDADFLQQHVPILSGQESNKGDSNQNTNRLQSQSEMPIRLCIAEIRNGNIDEALNEFSEIVNKEQQLNSIATIAYESKPENAENIMKFANRLLPYEQKEICYNALLSEIERNQHYEDKVLFEVAYNLKELMDSSKFIVLPEKLKKSFNNLKARLPVAVRDALWSTVCIECAYFQEQLLVNSNSLYNGKRYLLTWGGRLDVIETGSNQWILEPKHGGKYFAMKNKRYGEHIYPSSNEDSYNHSRRRIFTGVINSEADWKFWEILPTRNGSAFYVKNYANMEYLYPVIHNGDQLDDKRRSIYTWREVPTDPRGEKQYEWLINRC